MAGTRASEPDETTVLQPIGEAELERPLSRRELRRNRKRTRVRARRRTHSNDVRDALVSKRVLQRRERALLKRCFLLMLVVSVLFMAGMAVASVFVVTPVLKFGLIGLSALCAVGAPIPSLVFWRRAC